MELSIPLILLLASGLLIILFVVLYMFTNRNTSRTLGGGGDDMMRMASDIRQVRSDAIILIMIHQMPGQWLKVLRFDSGNFIAENYQGTIDPGNVISLAVAYANGEVFEWENLSFPLPPGWFQPQFGPIAAPLVFNPAMLTPGILSVRHADVRLRRDVKTYRLFIQNLTAATCRVHRYGCFALRNGIFVPITFHGGMYDAAAFRNRFGVQDDVLSPGKSVCDYFAAGDDLTVWWVFELEMPDGKWLLAGGEIYF